MELKQENARYRYAFTCGKCQNNRDGYCAPLQQGKDPIYIEARVVRCSCFLPEGEQISIFDEEEA